MILRRIGVVGAGIMGAGIAQVCAGAGWRFCFWTFRPPHWRPGWQQLEPAWRGWSRKESSLRRIRQQRWAASAQRRPEQFVGMHFFNPVPVMNLVELIVGMRTSAATLEAVRSFAVHLRKTPITAKNSPGFVVNRVLTPMINEAIFALQEGLASAQDIDAAMTLGCNHPIGPLALADMIGLDTLLAILNSLHQDIGDPKYRPAPMLRELVAAGFLGRKSGRGFFWYDQEDTSQGKPSKTRRQIFKCCQNQACALCLG